MSDYDDVWDRGTVPIEIGTPNFNLDCALASTQGGEKGWGIGFPQAFCCKSFACLAECGNLLSRLLPLFIGLCGGVGVRGSSRERPELCARQAADCRGEGIFL